MLPDPRCTWDSGLLWERLRIELGGVMGQSGASGPAAARIVWQHAPGPNWVSAPVYFSIDQDFSVRTCS